MWVERRQVTDLHPDADLPRLSLPRSGAKRQPWGGDVRGTRPAVGPHLDFSVQIATSGQRVRPYPRELSPHHASGVFPGATKSHLNAHRASRPTVTVSPPSVVPFRSVRSHDEAWRNTL